MEERKLLGMNRNVALGLSYLFPILAIIILIAEKDMDREDKVDCVASIWSILAVSITCSLYYIVNVIAAIKCFTGDTSFKLFLMDKLAEKCVK